MKTPSKKSITLIVFILLASIGLATTTLADGHIIGEARIFNQERLQGETYTLAVVPVTEFDLDSLALGMAALWVVSDDMQYHLDQAVAGNEASCAEFVDMHIFVWFNTVVFAEVPAQYAGAYSDYLTAILDYYDSVNPAFESCADTGQVTNHEYGAARLGIDRARTVLEPYFNGS